MYKVLIVDDEKIIRIAIKSMIPWEKEGFCADYSAKDGVEALEMVKLHNPHLIIADIMMPKMNGIEFVKTVRDNGFKGEIVLLTNHQNFSYAVEALRNGVSDYIIKTDITPQLLTECIAKIRQRLDQSSPVHADLPKISASEEDLNVLRESLSRRETSHEIFLSASYVFLNVFAKFRFTDNVSDNSIPGQALRNLALEHVKTFGYFVLPSGTNSVLIIIPQKKGEEEKLKERVLSLIKELSRLIRLYMNTQCGFILSKVFHNNTQFLESVAMLPNAEQLILYHGFETLIPETDCQLYKSQTIEPVLFIHTIQQWMNKSDYAGLKKAFENILSVLKTKKINPKRTISLIENMFKFTVLHNTIQLSSVKADVENLWQQIHLSRTLEEYIAAYHKLTDLIRTHALNISGISYRKEILEINNYIEQNIHKKITLSMIAQTINMSENYISRLFKSETGINIIHYINLQKMEHAKHLLEAPHIPIQNIALSLGFDETSYFNKLFHKFYSISPTEYRKIYVKLLK